MRAREAVATPPSAESSFAPPTPRRGGKHERARPAMPARRDVEAGARGARCAHRRVAARADGGRHVERAAVLVGDGGVTRASRERRPAAGRGSKKRPHARRRARAPQRNEDGVRRARLRSVAAPRARGATRSPNRRRCPRRAAASSSTSRRRAVGVGEQPPLPPRRAPPPRRRVARRRHPRRRSLARVHVGVSGTQRAQARALHEHPCARPPAPQRPLDATSASSSLLLHPRHAVAGRRRAEADRWPLVTITARAMLHCVGHADIRRRDRRRELAAACARGGSPRAAGGFESFERRARRGRQAAGASAPTHATASRALRAFEGGGAACDDAQFRTRRAATAPPRGASEPAARTAARRRRDAPARARRRHRGRGVTSPSSSLSSPPLPLSLSPSSPRPLLLLLRVARRGGAQSRAARDQRAGASINAANAAGCAEPPTNDRRRSRSGRRRGPRADHGSGADDASGGSLVVLRPLRLLLSLSAETSRRLWRASHALLQRRARLLSCNAELNRETHLCAHGRLRHA